MRVSGVSSLTAGNAPFAATIQVEGPGDIQLATTTLVFDDVPSGQFGSLGSSLAPMILTSSTAEFSSSDAGGVSTDPLVAISLSNATISSLGAGLVPGFSFAAVGLGVTFTDITTPPGDTWSWDFGDSGSSSLQNPVHTYAEGGTYTVVLSVSALSGPTATCSIPVTVS